GDTLNYTSTITNGNASAITNVQFSSSTDPNTTVVAGSLHASPLAINDSYTAVGNTQLFVGTSAGSNPGKVLAASSGLLANDTTLTDTTTTTAITNGATSQGGTVTVNTDGTFTYTPKTGFTGTDTFTYTAKNSAVATLTDTATVTITVSNLVWYVNSA